MSNDDDYIKVLREFNEIEMQVDRLTNRFESCLVEKEKDKEHLSQILEYRFQPIIDSMTRFEQKLSELVKKDSKNDLLAMKIQDIISNNDKSSNRNYDIWKTIIVLIVGAVMSYIVYQNKQIVDDGNKELILFKEQLEELKTKVEKK